MVCSEAGGCDCRVGGCGGDGGGAGKVARSCLRGGFGFEIVVVAKGGSVATLGIGRQGCGCGRLGVVAREVDGGGAGSVGA